MSGDLFGDEAGLPSQPTEQLADGAILMRRFVSAEAAMIVQRIKDLAELCPFRQMVSPRGGLVGRQPESELKGKKRSATLGPMRYVAAGVAMVRLQ